MALTLLDLKTWDRSEYFIHYSREVVCTYSLTVSLDIHPLKGQRLYPAMLWLLTDTVNEMPQFRTALTKEGVGIYDHMHPSYTIFNKEKENFSVIWTEFHPDYHQFLQDYEKDVLQYASSECFLPKENPPDNLFDVSMLPWVPFSSFNLNIYGSGTHMLPIFTMGKAAATADETLLPLAIQVHHAVCDGYHVGVFVDKLQHKISNFLKG